MLEFEMVDECYNYLSKKEDLYTDIAREVPFLSRCIDLVLISNKREIITIEFKVKNWREAIGQAKDHMLGADKVYICIPQKKPNDNFIDLLISEKIGLYLYDPKAPQLMTEYISAPVNSRKVNIFGDMIIDTLNSIKRHNA
jgi:hypothetical protein